MDYLHPDAACSNSTKCNSRCHPPAARQCATLRLRPIGSRISGRIERGLAAPSITRIALRKLRELRKPLGQGSAQAMRKDPRGWGKSLGPI